MAKAVGMMLFVAIVMAATVYQQCSCQKSCVDINAGLINRKVFYCHCFGSMKTSIKLLQVDDRQKQACHVVNLQLSGASQLIRPTDQQNTRNPFSSR